MAFTPFSTNVKNLEGLGTDKPNAVLGLSGLQLRQRFDKAVTDIKDWINDTFLPEIGGIGGAANIGITQISGMQAENVQEALVELNDTRGEVEDGAVTLSKLASGFLLPTGKLADGAVTKAKIGEGATYTALTAVLSAAGWTENAQTVNVTGVTASNTVIVSPDPDSFTRYTEAQIRAIAQGVGTLTFLCETVPTENVTANIVVLT